MGPTSHRPRFKTVGPEVVGPEVTGPELNQKSLAQKSLAKNVDLPRWNLHEIPKLRRVLVDQRSKSV